MLNMSFGSISSIIKFIGLIAFQILSNYDAHSLNFHDMISLLLGDKLVAQFEQRLPGIFTDLEVTSDSTSLQKVSSSPSNGRFIMGYWQNYSPASSPGGSDNTRPAYYMEDIKPVSHVMYAFLTLAKAPNPKTPPKMRWDGICIYESMCRDDVMNVLAGRSADAWFTPRLSALVQAVQEAGKNFVWAIGGASDLTLTISDGQVDDFVTHCVELLKVAGDGIDLDWEHLSDGGQQGQRQTFAAVLLKLRSGLDNAGLHSKQIGFTTRHNAFWDGSNRPAGFPAFNSDGEGLDIDRALKESGSSINQVVDWVNIMMYDESPANLGSPGGVTLETFKKVMTQIQKTVQSDKIVVGFEPGAQANGGVWEGLTTDMSVIDWIKETGLGGSMFWALNQVGSGDKVKLLAEYSSVAYNQI